MRNMSLAVRIAGGLVIVYGLLVLLSGLRGVSVNPFAMLELSGAAALWKPAQLILLGVGLLGACLAGTGFILLRPWGRLIGTLYAGSILVSMLWNVWLYGPQNFGAFHYAGWLGGAVLLAGFLQIPGVRAAFAPDPDAPVAPSPLVKTGGILLVAGMALQLAAVPAGSVWLIARSRAAWSAPAVTKYAAPQSAADGMGDRQVMGYRLRMPKDMAMASFFVNGTPPVWRCFIGRMKEGDDADIVVDISSKSPMEGYGEKTMRFFGFRKTWALERALYHRPWNPLLAGLGRAAFEREGRPSVEEAYADGWRGFVRILRSKEDGMVMYDCHLYDYEDSRSAGVVVKAYNGALDEAAVRSILGSFRFDEGKMAGVDYFAAGMAAQTAGNDKKALEHYFNACYRDDRTVEYMLRAGDTQVKLRRLRSARSLFKRALALEPGNARAGKGLSLCGPAGRDKSR